MKWLDNWFLKKARWAWSVPQEADEGSNLVMTGSPIKNKTQAHRGIPT